MVNQLTIGLPKNLNNMLKFSIWKENINGESHSRVFHIQNTSFGNNAYLKVVESSKEDLQKEAKILKWLKGKLPVPEVYYYEQYQGTEYLLISELQGIEVSESMIFSNPEKMIGLLANGLKMIHQVSIRDCPFEQTLDVKLIVAKQNLIQGLVDEEDFQPENLGKTADEIYNLVLVNKPKSEDLVFIHGDFCLPNMIIKNSELSGFIDWGRGGIGDRYQDLALAVRSIQAMGLDDQKEMVDLFCKTYGLTAIDYSKIDYYITLDELF